jgi:cell division transport system ATP-binding protein
MVDLSHVSKVYGSRTALRDVSLSVARDEFVVVHGPSGAGKTTLLRLIMMEELPTQGTVTVHKWSSTRASSRRVSALRRRLGVLFQDFRLLRDHSVFENVALPLRVMGDASGSEVRRRVQEALSSVGLATRADARPRELSGGEQQRVALARALVSSPYMLLADEPTGNLDAATGAGIVDLLRALPARGTGVILATHDGSIAERLGVRAIELLDGRVVNGA